MGISVCFLFYIDLEGILQNTAPNIHLPPSPLPMWKVGKLKASEGKEHRASLKQSRDRTQNCTLLPLSYPDC